MQVKIFTFNPFQENTYVLHDEVSRQCMIVDPGCHTATENKELSDYITTNQLTPTLLVNTHCHIDHIMGNGYVSETYNLPLHLHREEESTMQHSAGWGQMYGLSIGPQPAERIYINEKSVLTLGEQSFQLLYTPGHSVASLSIYAADAGIVIAGDVLFRMGIGRYDLPGGDFDTLRNSIHTQLFTLPDKTKVYPGHGEPTTIGYEKLNNPYVKL